VGEREKLCTCIAHGRYMSLLGYSIDALWSLGGSDPGHFEIRSAARKMIFKNKLLNGMVRARGSVHSLEEYLLVRGQQLMEVESQVRTLLGFYFRFSSFFFWHWW